MVFRKESGFTLIEVAASVLILMIASVSLYGIYNSTLRILHRSQWYTELNQQGTLALQLMEGEIWRAKTASISNDGRHLTLDTVINTKGQAIPGTIEFYRDNGNKVLYKKVNGSNPKRSPSQVADYVDKVEFRREGRCIIMTLFLRKGAQELKMNSRATLRYGGVY